MRFNVVALKDYLRAELLERESAHETREFLNALAAEALKTGQTRVLICVHTSRPIFRVEEYRASRYLKELASRPGTKVALVSSRMDIRAAHEYLEVLARQQGANVRSFSDESHAAAWLCSGDAPAEAAGSDQDLLAKSP